MSSKAKRKGDSLRPRRVAGASALSFLLLLGQSAPLLANPTGGSVVAGAASIGAAGKTLTINQSTNAAIINWQTFSIANGETTKFVVPNSTSATLNFVTAANNPSLIYGTLSSNGQLYLINPSGIVVGASGRIDTAGFLGSTLNPNNSAFLAGGNLNFSGNSTAGVDNQGVISASGGNVYLIANQVSNEGSLLAPQGEVGLAAGSNVLLAQQGDQHLFVQSNPIGTTRAVGVSNSGTVRAATAELRTAGGNAYALAINNSGSIVATGYKKINGQVYLTADTGVISNSGTIRATGHKHGGKVQLTSKSGTVRNSGTINVSATRAGGVGGSVLLKSAQGEAANTGLIESKGGQGGAGGDVEVSGNTVDVMSGEVDTLAPDGKTGMFTLDPVIISIVPASLDVAPTGGDLTGAYVSTQLSTTNYTLDASSSVTVNDQIIWGTANTLTIETTGANSTIAINQSIAAPAGTVLIEGASGCTITTGALGTVDVGSFILDGGSWNQNTTYLPSFSATNFTLENNTTSGSQSSFLRVVGGQGTTSNPYEVEDVYGLQGIASPSSAYLSDSFKLVDDIDASSTSGWNSGAGFTPIGNSTTPFTGTFNGAGATISNLTLNQPTGSNVGLFGVTGPTSLVENVNLTDASVTGYQQVGALVGTNGGNVKASSSTGTITSNASGSFTSPSEIGGLVGENSGLVEASFSSATVNGGSGVNDIGGLVGENDGVIEDSYAYGAVNGANDLDVGGLAGYSSGTVSSSSASGTVTGTGTASGNYGGLVGTNEGSISDSFATGEVSTGISSGVEVGGLVGQNGGTIAGSYATEKVSGAAFVAGLVGYSDGPGVSIQSSYATGAVSGDSDIGGLVGDLVSGTIQTSFATGAVTGTGGGDIVSIGGLAGASSGTISGSYATGAVSGGSEFVGGLVGYNSGTVQTSYAWGSVSGGSSVGGLVGNNLGSVATTYSTGSVSGSSTVGGLIGATGTASSVTASYWANDVGNNSSLTTFGDSNNGSVDSYTMPESTANLENIATFSGAPGWSFSTTWQIATNGGVSTTPLLDSLSVTILGSTSAAQDSVDLIGNGKVLYTTTDFEGEGNFNLTVPADVVTSGALLTDTTGNASSTFYIAGTIPTAPITNVNLSANLLTVLGSGVASNHGLGAAVGSLTGDGINYGVSGSALTTNSGVGMTISSNYKLDGNITVAGGSLLATSTAQFASPYNVTLTAPAITITGSNFAGPGDLTFNATTGAVDFSSVGDSGIPATLGGVTINSATTPEIVESIFQLRDGGMSITGTGGSSGDGDGVDIFNSSIASYGNIAITGTGGSYTNSTVEATVAGYGVDIGSSNILGLGEASVSLNGVNDNTVTSYYGLAGVEINNVGFLGTIGNSSEVQTFNGLLSVNGAVSGVTVSASGSGGGLDGIDVEDGSSLVALGAKGAISLIGDAAGSTNDDGNADGVLIAGYDSRNSTAYTSSVVSYGGGNPLTSAYTGVSIHGTGGTVLSNSSNGGNSADGVRLNHGATVTGYGPATITVIGQGGTNMAGGSNYGSANGIDFNANTVNDNGTGSVEVDTNNGNILIQGTGGSSPRLAGGVVMAGLNGSSTDMVSVTVASDNGNITINGTGGSGYTGSGVITGNYSTSTSIPNYGVGIVDDVAISANNGAVSITGNGGANSPDVSVIEAPASTVDAYPVAPTVLSGGVLTVNATGNGGIYLGAGLSGSANATLTSATSITIDSDSSIDFSGQFTANANGGFISINGVGNSETPIQTGGVDLTATSYVALYNDDFNVTGGDFTASGNGFVSNSTQGDTVGVDIFDTDITLDGGNVTLTGAGGYDSESEGALNAGDGVAIGSDGNALYTISTTDTGNITISGTVNQGITTQSGVDGVNIYVATEGSELATSNLISVENGSLKVTGTVTGVTGSSTAVNGGTIGGVFVDVGSEIVATGTGGGSVTILGDTSGATTDVVGTNLSFIHGVEISGVVGVNGGVLTITGNAGTLNTTNSQIDTANEGSDGTGNLPASVGVAVDSGQGSGAGNNILSGPGSTVAITGTGGSVVTSGAFTGHSDGVVFDTDAVADFGTAPTLPNGVTLSTGTGNGSAVTINGTAGSVNAGFGANSSDADSAGINVGGSITVEDGGSLAVTGQGGALDISNISADATGGNFPGTEGISLGGNSSVVAIGSAPITLVGTGGNVNAGSHRAVDSVGVDIGDSDGNPVTLDVQDGALSITGTGGNSPSLGVGVAIYGFKGTSVSIVGNPSDGGSSTTQVTINGTGGSGYGGSGTFTGNYAPNNGVIIADDISVNTSEGISITGQGGANSNGIAIDDLSNDTAFENTSASQASPQLTGSAISLTSTSGNVLVNGGLNVTQAALTITSPGSIVINDTSGTGAGEFVTNDLNISAAGPITINNTINGSGTDLITTTNGNITLGPSGSVNDDGINDSEAPNVLTIAAGTDLPHSHYIINDNTTLGSGAITATGGAVFDLYQADSVSNTLGGITGTTQYGVSYPDTSLPSGNGLLYYVANASITGPNPINGSTPPPSGGTTTTTPPIISSTTVPPVIVPQNNPSGNTDPGTTPPNTGTGNLAGVWGGSVIPPFSFTGGVASQTGNGAGGLASSSGNGGTIGAGDAALVFGGGVSNIPNPGAYNVLDYALGAAVHSALDAALAAFGGWTDVDYSANDNGNGADQNGSNEIEIGSGGVVVIGNNQVHDIPLNQAPPQLQNALSNGVQHGLNGGH